MGLRKKHIKKVQEVKESQGKEWENIFFVVSYKYSIRVDFIFELFGL